MEVVPPGTFPFDAVNKAKAAKKLGDFQLEKHLRDHLSRELSQAIQQDDWDQIEDLVQDAFNKGFISEAEAHELGKTLDDHKYVAQLKEKIAPTVKSKSNPMSGKGNSYADRVEGPDGWGHKVPRTRLDDDLDELFHPF